MAISVRGLPRSESDPPSLARPGADRCDSFEDLYREFVPRITGFVRRRVSDPGLVDDIVHETLLRAYRFGLHHETGNEQWRWLATVARNLCIDVRALHRNWREHSVGDPARLDLTVHDHDPEAHAIAAERRDRVSRALRMLPERDRRLLLRKHLEGRGVREVAEVEGMHVEAVKSALRRARRSFRASYAAISDRNGVASVFGPVTAAVSLRLRAWRARLGDLGSQASSLAAQAGASASLSATMTTAVVIGALVVGPTATGAGRDRPPDVSSAEGEHGLLDDSVPIAAQPVGARHLLGRDAQAGRERIEGPVGAHQPPEGSDHGAAPVAAKAAPGPSQQEPVGPGVAPGPVDLGPDRVDEPEDAMIMDVAYASDSEGPAGPQASSEGTSPGAPAAREAETSGDGAHGGSPPELFALGHPQDGAAYGCRVDAQCGSPMPEAASRCRLQCTVLFHSLDGGTTWERLPAEGLDAWRLLVPPTYPRDRRLFAYGNLGLQVSTDGGRTFSMVLATSAALTNARFWPGFGDGGEQRIVLGGLEGGWIHHADTGVTQTLPVGPVWVTGIGFAAEGGTMGVLLTIDDRPAMLHRQTAEVAAVYCRDGLCERRFAFPSRSWVTVFAGERWAGGVLVVGEGGPYRTTDAGRSFERMELPPGIGSLTQVVGGRIYAHDVEYLWNSSGPAQRTSVIHVSDDGGRSWSRLGRSPGQYAMELVVLPDGRMVATGSLGPKGRKPGPSYVGLMCSDDGGSTWHARCPTRGSPR